MKVFNGIIGALAIFGALHCILWEGTSFLNYGWVVMLILLLWGICGIITFIIDLKEDKRNDANLAFTGIISLVLGIAGLVVTIAALRSAVVQAVFILIVFAIFVIFMFITGIRALMISYRTKKSENPKGWIFSLVIGIILLLIGIGGLISWLCLDALSGTAMGVMLGVFGCTLIASVFRHDDYYRYG